ncbi:MAG: tetratricopeptide repeat protein [Candidatus Binatia bacterium]
MNRERTTLLSVLLLLSLPLLSLAAEIGLQASLLKKGEEHLDAWRVQPAEEVVTRLIGEDPNSLQVLDLKARLDFYQGRYEEALGSVEKALAIESDHERLLALRLLTRRTHDTVKKLRRHESAHFILYLDEDKDGILVPYALNTLERSYEAIGKELGFFPQAKVRVEIAPDVASFNAISTLSLRDIEETGAVGICKFNKIMTISPRVLMHGYRWLDSLSHEYLHYVIVSLSSNKAPIWLHEGMARFYETLWRRPNASQDKPDYLTPANETLLARALDKNQFIGFKKMEPSLIHLETPEEVQLAYAEASSAIDFIVHQKGDSGLREILAEVDQMSTPQAIEQVLGVSFEAFESQWKEYLKGRGLQEIEGTRVRKLKVKKDQEQDHEAVDLKEIQSVVARNRTHLGDRLWERGRTIAASREYRRALQVSPHSIIILNKLARILIQMRRYEEALPHLKKAKALDPDRASTYIKLGHLYHATQNNAAARAALEEAIQINPFDPTIYHLLYQVHIALGDPERAKDSKATLWMLIRQR